jgi:antibiotic biosynthesis monooxygenase (ABM) superfamily enzyme
MPLKRALSPKETPHYKLLITIKTFIPIIKYWNKGLIPISGESPGKCFASMLNFQRPRPELLPFIASVMRILYSA